MSCFIFTFISLVVVQTAGKVLTNSFIILICMVDLTEALIEALI